MRTGRRESPCCSGAAVLAASPVWSPLPLACASGCAHAGAPPPVTPVASAPAARARARPGARRRRPSLPPAPACHPGVARTPGRSHPHRRPARHDQPRTIRSPSRCRRSASAGSCWTRANVQSADQVRTLIVGDPRRRRGARCWSPPTRRAGASPRSPPCSAGSHRPATRARSDRPRCRQRATHARPAAAQPRGDRRLRPRPRCHRQPVGRPHRRPLLLRRSGDRLAPTRSRSPAGCREGGVTPVLKHFPGLGAADANTHLTAPVVERSGMGADLPRHAAVRRRDQRRRPGGHGRPRRSTRPSATPDLPASLSPAIYQQLRSLPFHGVTITDSLGMGAVNLRFDFPVAAVKALAAGSRRAAHHRRQPGAADARRDRRRGAQRTACRRPGSPTRRPTSPRWPAAIRIALTCRARDACRRCTRRPYGLEGVPQLRVALAQIDVDRRRSRRQRRPRRRLERQGRATPGAHLVASSRDGAHRLPGGGPGAARAPSRPPSQAALHRLAARLAAEGLGELAVVVGYLDTADEPVARVGRPAGEPRERLRAAATAARSSPATPSTTCPTTASSTSSATSCPATASRSSGCTASTSRSDDLRGPLAGRRPDRRRRARPRSASSLCINGSPYERASPTPATSWPPGAPARPARRSPTSTWSAARTSWSSTATA